MSWLACWFLSAFSRTSRKAGSAPWWRGRALMASVLHFGLAMASLLLVGLAIAPQWR